MLPAPPFSSLAWAPRASGQEIRGGAAAGRGHAPGDFPGPLGCRPELERAGCGGRGRAVTPGPRAPAGWQVRQRSLRRAARGGRAGGVRAAGPGSRLLPQSVSVTRGPWIHRLHGEGVKGDVLSYPLRSPSPPGSLSLLVRRCSFLASSRPPAPPNLAPALCSDVGPQEAAGGNPRVPDLGRHCGVRSSLCCPRR